MHAASDDMNESRYAEAFAAGRNTPHTESLSEVGQKRLAAETAQCWWDREHCALEAPISCG